MKSSSWLAALDGATCYSHRRTPVEQLVETHLHLCEHMVDAMYGRYPSHISRDELVAEAQLGLFQAAKTFDETRGLQFTMHAPNRIRGAMLDYLRSIDPMSRQYRTQLREQEIERMREVQRVGYDVQADPAPFVAREIRVTQFHEIENEFKTDTFEPASPHEEAPESLSRDRLFEKITRSFTMRERVLFWLYYVMNRTMKEIGAALDLSESRVSQMHSALCDYVRRHTDEAEKAEFFREAVSR